MEQLESLFLIVLQVITVQLVVLVDVFMELVIQVVVEAEVVLLDLEDQVGEEGTTLVVQEQEIPLQ